MSERSGILAGGNWIVDKLKVIDVYPQQDALANILEESIGNGGSPFNILLDLAKLGVDFSLSGIGRIGDDADGHWILDECKNHGIDTQQLRSHADVPTSHTDVMTVRDTGRRTFFHQRGANAFLSDTDFCFEKTTARIFHLGYLLLLDGLDAPDSEFGTVAARVLHRARAAGCRTSIDVVSEDSDRFADIVLPALPHVDYCILNEFEIERSTGIPTRPNGRLDLSAIQKAARQLLEKGVKAWVIVHFPEGAYALGANGEECAQGSIYMPQEKIISTVGAGDAFAAGVLYGLHEDFSIQDSLCHGVSIAAASLQGIGTSNGINKLSDCLALGKIHGFRNLPFRLSTVRDA
ncbi:MAG: carbohydrate kinase family protein [Chthoniobacterales bacterium]